MKISLNWLKKFTDFKSSPEELAEALTMTGLEVESIDYPFDYLKDVITGRIEKIIPHPNADKLRICMVNTGKDENLQIVCGAPNVYENMVGPVALPGTELPGGIKLKKSKIRGEVSMGMLCSSKELGITEDGSGIMDLPSDIIPGTSLTKALGLDGAVLEVDLTPNRADCLSLIGIAREVSAIEGTKIIIPSAEIYKDEKNKGEITEKACVEVKDPDLCPKYCARYIDNVKVLPSPFWLQSILLCSGIRPINNIVDVTNYIMLETGQPLHAFDYDEIKNSKIIVQRAMEGEKFTALDGKERILDSEILMICDNEKKVAAAGIMGGENSEITDKTTKVLLESAYFFPPSIRKSAKKLGLSTDSSHRFERGVDPLQVERALNRAASLIEELGKGKTAQGFIDTQTKPFEERKILFSPSECNMRLGINLSPDQSLSYLKSVGFIIEETKDEDKYLIKVPSYRVDVERPEDLSEEVARRYGYNNIPTTSPKISSDKQDESEFALRLEIKDAMKSLGFNEAINYSFIGSSLLEKTGLTKDFFIEPVRILNPLSEDQALMRTDLVPGILENISSNLSRQITNLRLFETGQVFFPDSKLINKSIQKEYIAAAITGKRRNSLWDDKSPEADFFDMKGFAEAFFKNFNIEPEFIVSEILMPYSRNGASADIIINGKKYGSLFEVSPKVLKNYNIEQKVFIFNCPLEAIIKNKKDVSLSREVPKFPAILRDITVITPRYTQAGKIISLIKNLNEEFIENVILFDIYEGEAVNKNEKSLSFRITYRSSKETLKDKQINKVHEKVTSSLLKNFEIRFPGQD
ncbi:MAG: phenylalanine--tRNA ligase subunit beta [Desulforegulaceae bacterium]|nr:phenylalanine--tRNA ligase subunit beta [Desulforegulaceae bacterium]